jgi:hypothetical protein
MNRSYFCKVTLEYLQGALYYFLPVRKWDKCPYLQVAKKNCTMKELIIIRETFFCDCGLDLYVALYEKIVAEEPSSLPLYSSAIAECSISSKALRSASMALLRSL